jgi:hypothetical protein
MPLGAAVTFTAAASGGQGPYQYRWWLISNGVYTSLSTWISSNTFTWTPTTLDANAQIQVRARSTWNSGDYEAQATVAFPVLMPVSNVSLTANRPSPMPVGTTATFTANASAGQGPYQYRWWLISDGVYTALSTWTTSNTLSWTPTTIDPNAQIQARARSAWNSGDYEAQMTLAFPVLPAVSGVTLTANMTAPQGLGKTINFTAGASGGQGPYQYRWWVISNGVYTALSNWTSSSTFSWTPTSADPNAQIQARVRSAWNSGDYEAQTTANFPIITRTNFFTLAWNQNPEPGIAGYYVYIGTTPGSYTTSIDVGKATRYIYTSAVPGGTYYVTVAAYMPGPIVGNKASALVVSTSP